MLCYCDTNAHDRGFWKASRPYIASARLLNMHSTERGEESGRRDTEDLMFNKRESLWHGIRAGPSLNIKEPGGELDGWSFPSEVLRGKKELWEKGRRYLSISESESVLVTGTKAHARTHTHFHTFLKSGNLPLFTLFERVSDKTKLWHIISKLLRSLSAPAVATLPQLLFWRVLSLSLSNSQQLYLPASLHSQRATLKTVETLNQLCKLDEVRRSDWLTAVRCCTETTRDCC